MQALPLVSVILPVKNGGRFFLDAVNSVLAQSFHCFELIIVDDHSDDGFIQQLPADERITIIHSPGQGVCAAFNTGLDRARAPYIARMDADDLCHVDRLREQYEYLETNKEITVCASQVEIFCHDREVGEGFKRYERWQNSLLGHDDVVRGMFVESPIVNPSMMMRSEAIQALGSYTDSLWPEDYDLWLRGFMAGWKFGKISKVLLRWRDSSTRLTRTDPRYHQEQFFDCKIFYFASLLKKQNRNIVIAGAGPIGKMVFHGLKKNGISVAGFLEVDKRKIGQKLYGIPVLSAENSSLDNEFYYLGAVGQIGGRHRLGDFFKENGLKELVDYYLLA